MIRLFESSKEMVDYVNSQTLGDKVTIKISQNRWRKNHYSGKWENGIGIGLIDRTEVSWCANQVFNCEYWWSWVLEWCLVYPSIRKLQIQLFEMDGIMLVPKNRQRWKWRYWGNWTLVVKLLWFKQPVTGAKANFMLKYRHGAVEAKWLKQTWRLFPKHLRCNYYLKNNP